MRKGLLVLSLLVTFCTPKDPVPVPVISDYLPLKTGAYWIYDVDSVIINQNAETKYSYTLKVEVTDSFPSSDGTFTYVLHRSKQDSSEMSWTALESWSARVAASQAVVNEGNISFVKLAGPLQNGKSWNGNAYNIIGGNEKCANSDSYSCDNYTIGSFNKPYAINPGMNFDHTLTVIQNDNEDLIVELDKRSEIYAKEVGLIYREITILNYCTDQNCLGTQFVNSGLKYKQTISSYEAF